MFYAFELALISADPPCEIGEQPVVCRLASEPHRAPCQTPGTVAQAERAAEQLSPAEAERLRQQRELLRREQMAEEQAAADNIIEEVDDGDDESEDDDQAADDDTDDDDDTDEDALDLDM